MSAQKKWEKLVWVVSSAVGVEVRILAVAELVNHFRWSQTYNGGRGSQTEVSSRANET